MFGPLRQWFNNNFGYPPPYAGLDVPSAAAHPPPPPPLPPKPEPVDLSKLDYPSPSKTIVIPQRIIDKREKIFQDPDRVLIITNWAGKALKEDFDPDIYADRAWNTHICRMLAWVLNGEWASSPSAPNKHDMIKIFKFYDDAPDFVKPLLEPMVAVWKILAFHPDSAWWGSDIGPRKAEIIDITQSVGTYAGEAERRYLDYLEEEGLDTSLNA